MNNQFASYCSDFDHTASELIAPSIPIIKKDNASVDDVKACNHKIQVRCTWIFNKGKCVNSREGIIPSLTPGNSNPLVKVTRYSETKIRLVKIMTRVDFIKILARRENRLKRPKGSELMVITITAI